MRLAALISSAHYRSAHAASRTLQQRDRANDNNSHDWASRAGPRLQIRTANKTKLVLVGQNSSTGYMPAMDCMAMDCMGRDETGDWDGDGAPTAVGSTAPTAATNIGTGCCG